MEEARVLPEYLQALNRKSIEEMYLVGRKKPNPFGLYDMLGGMYEWCSDWYAADYYARSPMVDPSGPGSPQAAHDPQKVRVLDPGLDAGREVRVLRGGGGSKVDLLTRSAFRLGLGTTGGHVECNKFGRRVSFAW